MASELYKQAITKIDRSEVGKLAAWMTLNPRIKFIEEEVIAFRVPAPGEAWMGESGTAYFGETSQERPILAQGNTKYADPTYEDISRINKEGPFPGRVSNDTDEWYVANIHALIEGKWLATVGKHTSRYTYAQVIE